ncbi:MAG: ABC transporter ATP-binding protein [Desulfitobacteriia bacterium]|jgi:iron complex transport system ATP-binding protein
MILSVRGLEFQYPSREVLENINLSVEEGDFLAVLGVNGAGKSTLLRCLNRILKPQGGTIFIRGVETIGLRRKELAQKIGYVSQRQETNNTTVFDAVLLGRKPYIQWEASSQDLEITRQVLKTLQLENYEMRYLNELSGGELQKVLIARALAQEPELLLLDEPTSSLDLKNQLEVASIIQNLVRERAIAAVAALHDLNLAIRFANKFLLLKKGKVFAAGGLEVITPKNIKSVYSVAVKIRGIDGVPVVIPV